MQRQQARLVRILRTHEYNLTTSHLELWTPPSEMKAALKDLIPDEALEILDRFFPESEHQGWGTRWIRLDTLQDRDLLSASQRSFRPMGKKSITRARRSGSIAQPILFACCQHHWH